MKKYSLYFAIVALGILAISTGFRAAADSTTNGVLDPWKVSGTTITPRVASNTVAIPSLATTTAPCLTVNASGTIGRTTCLGSSSSQYKIFLTVGSSNADYITTGSSDQTQINAAFAYAKANGGTVYVKAGTYHISAPIVSSVSGIFDLNATVIADNSMAAVFQFGDGSSRGQNDFIIGGIFNANNNANDGLQLRNYSNLKIQNVTVQDALTNSFEFGDDTLLPATSYEAIVSNDHVIRTSGGTVPSSSVGLYINTSATDGYYTDSILEGSNTGVVTKTGSNFFRGLHTWVSSTLTGSLNVGFDDYGDRNHWESVEADSFELYGIRFRGFYSTLINSIIRSDVALSDGTGIGVQIDNVNSSATVDGNTIRGGSNSSRLSWDISTPSPSLASASNNTVQYSINSFGVRQIQGYVFPQNSSLVSFYNTSDETTNYTRTQLGFSNNQFVIKNQPGGSGSNKSIAISSLNAGGSGSTMTVSPTATTTLGDIELGRSSGTNYTELNIDGSQTQSSGLYQGFLVNPSISQSGTSGFTNVLISPSINSVGSGVQELLRVQSTNASSSPFVVIYNGTSTSPNVGIGTSSPVTPLDVNGSSTFRGNFFLPGLGTTGCLGLGSGGLISTTTCLSAAITSLNGSTSSTQTFATSGPALSISTLNGVHTWSLPTSTASVTGVLSSTDWTTFNNKQSTLTLPLSTANGGTNYSTGWTQGSIVFASTTSQLGEKNAQLFWDNTNNRLGIGTTTPSSLLSVTGNGGALALGLGNAADVSASFAGTRSFVGYKDSSSYAILQGGGGKGVQLQVNNSTFGSGTVGLTVATSGNVGIRTATPSETLAVNGGFALQSSSSTITTAAIGGAIVSGGCDSATSTIDSSLSTSTTAFVTTPSSDPGTTLGGTWAYSFISSAGVLTTRVCANVSVTPNSIPYIVKIIR